MKQFLRTMLALAMLVALTACSSPAPVADSASTADSTPVANSTLAASFAPAADSVSETAAPSSSPSDGEITVDEATALLTQRLGEKDAATGNTMSYGYTETLTLDGKSYYRFRISWLVDGNHMSYITDYIVATDGTELLEYLPDEWNAQGEYRLITAEEAKRIIDTETDYILLDVRTDAEFSEKHIPGAILIPDYEIEERAAKDLPDKSQKILIYCRTGRRSAIAAKALIAMGYTDVLDFGGITTWPYDTVTE